MFIFPSALSCSFQGLIFCLFSGLFWPSTRIYPHALMVKKKCLFFPPNLIHRCSTLIHPLPELSVLVPVSVRPFSQKCSICHDWSALTGLSRAPPTLALNVCKVSECECFAVDTTFTVFIQHLDLLYDQIRHSPILQYDTFKIAVVKFRVTAERCDFIIALHLHLQRFWYKT